MSIVFMLSVVGLGSWVYKEALKSVRMNLNELQRKELGIPPEGQWYGLQAFVFNLVGFLVAWDKPGTTGSKVYGVYKSVKHFYRCLALVPADKRHGYELIQECTQCILYFDIEYEGPPENKRRLHMIENVIRNKVKSRFGYDADLDIQCATRNLNEQGTIQKHSYHIFVTNVLFPCNHDGAMKEFATNLGTTDDWYYIDRAGHRKHIVDDSVYTRNRVFRLEGCCKASDPYKTPFVRINSDFTIRESASVIPLSNRNVRCSVVTDKKQKVAKTTHCSRQAPLKIIDTPFSIAGIYELLRSIGDSVSRISKIESDGNRYSIQCNQAKQGRPCPFNPAIRHGSNNLILRVNLAGNNKWIVHCQCMSLGCQKLVPLAIGYVLSRYEDVDPTELHELAPVELNDESAQKALSDDGNQPPDEVYCEPELHELAPVELHDESAQQALSDDGNQPPDEVYCEPVCRNLSLDAGVKVLVAPCGTGKTKSMHCLLLDLAKRHAVDHLLVVLVTHRHATSSKALTTLPMLNNRSWVKYDNIRGPIDIEKHQLIVIQYESLSRLTGYCKKNYGRIILVLDEFCSIGHQMHGNLGNPVMAQLRFYELCRYSRYVLAMDAHFDQRYLDILKRYTGRRTHVTQNTFQSRAHQTFKITSDEKQSIEFVIRQMQQGNHVIAPCFCKDTAEKIYKAAKSNFGDSKNILLYTGESRWDGEDINVSWKLADLVIHTSTIDCGLSFEVRGHFQQCVCFFHNKVGPTYETGLQMLSRSRDTCDFLICIRHIDVPCQDESIDVILTDFRKTELLLMMEALFHGILNVRDDNGNGTWATCNAYVGVCVMTEVVRRRTINDIQAWLVKLLRHDGARIERMVFKTGHTGLLETNPDIRVPKSEKQKQARVERLEQVYRCKFDADNTMKRLDSATAFSTFQNLCMLAVMGQNFLSALAQKLRDMCKAKAGFEMCRQSGNFNDVVQSRAEVLAGVTGDCYDYYANESARVFIEAVLGFPDPFSLPIQKDTELSARLGCTLVISEEKEILFVPDENARKLLRLLNVWISCRPVMHAPFRIPTENQLTFVKIMHLANHVLRIMFDLQYIRCGTAKQTLCNGKRSYAHTYALQESVLFTRCKSEKNKPVVPAWATDPPRDLEESEILAVRNDIVQPAAPFTIRQSSQYTLQHFEGIQKVHMQELEIFDVEVHRNHIEAYFSRKETKAAIIGQQQDIVKNTKRPDEKLILEKVLLKLKRRQRKKQNVCHVAPSDDWGQSYKEDVLNKERAVAPWVFGAPASAMPATLKQAAIGDNMSLDVTRVKRPRELHVPASGTRTKRARLKVLRD
jgi:hypothetical protein